MVKLYIQSVSQMEHRPNYKTITFQKEVKKLNQNIWFIYKMM